MPMEGALDDGVFALSNGRKGEKHWKRASRDPSCIRWWIRRMMFCWVAAAATDLLLLSVPSLDGNIRLDITDWFSTCLPLAKTLKRPITSSPFWIFSFLFSFLWWGCCQQLFKRIQNVTVTDVLDKYFFDLSFSSVAASRAGRLDTRP